MGMLPFSAVADCGAVVADEGWGAKIGTMCHTYPTFDICGLVALLLVSTSLFDFTVFAVGAVLVGVVVAIREHFNFFS